LIIFIVSGIYGLAKNGGGSGCKYVKSKDDCNDDSASRSSLAYRNSDGLDSTLSGLNLLVTFLLIFASLIYRNRISAVDVAIDNV
jgi:hypothetical protein